MATYVFDLETDGLLEKLTRVHSLVFYDPDAKQMYSACDDPNYQTDRGTVLTLDEGIRMLSQADVLVGHNILRFDIPALAKVYPEYDWMRPRVEDTMLMSMLVFPDIKISDMGKKKAGKKNVPTGKAFGGYSLEAWGVRLNLWKGDYAENEKKKGKNPWARWKPAMQRYCEQDVAVTTVLWQRCSSLSFPHDAFKMEHDFMRLDQRRMQHGFRFDEARAEQIHIELLHRKAELDAKLRNLFDPWWVCVSIETPQKSLNYKDVMTPDRVKGAKFSKIVLKEFDPGNRHHVIDRLVKVWGWEPKEFTKSGEPKLDDLILSELDHPRASELAEYFMVQKRLGQLSDGKKAWFNFVKDGRIHGRITTAGAVTRRCTHHDPNLSQVPSVKVPYGPEMRECFLADEGHKLVGIDASGLELRCLAHYLAPYDGGAYAKAVVEGTSENENDAHSLNCKALGYSPNANYVVNGKHTTGRDLAKRFIYAFLYGAGDYKLGLTVGLEDGEIERLRIEYPEAWAKAPNSLKFKKLADTPTRRAMVVKGGVLRANFMAGMPALRKLLADLKGTLKHRPYIYTIDGATMPIRHPHAILNTLLQSTGAIIVKYATVEAARRLTEKGYTFGEDWALVMHSHDELQCSTPPENVDEVGQTVIDSMEWAGEMLKLNVEITGEYKHGDNWRQTH